MTDARIWARDLDGTGSMHPCAKGDMGAIEFIRADLVEPLVEALRIIAGRQQCIDNLMSNADVARAALSSWEAAQ